MRYTGGEIGGVGISRGCRYSYSGHDCYYLPELYLLRPTWQYMGEAQYPYGNVEVKKYEDGNELGNSDKST